MKRRGFDREELVVLGALGLLIVTTALRAWSAGGSWFYSDDFIFLGDVARGLNTADWYLEPHNVHFMPFSRWLIAWVAAAGTFAWWAAALQIIVLQVVAGVTCWWMLRRLFGDRPGILIALALYLLAPATFPTTVWWAAAINQLPHQIALMGAVAAHVGYLRSSRPSDALVTGLFLLLGYASYTKSILIVPLLLVLTFCYFASGGPVARMRETLGRYWHGWAVLGGLTAAYLWVYLTVAPSSPLPEGSVVAETLDLSIVQSAIPSLLGGPWTWQSLGAPGGVGPRLFTDVSLLAALAAWSVLLGLTIAQSLRWRRAWWPLAIVLGYAVASALIIAVGRSTAFGAGFAGLELRYFADLACVAALGLGLATMPLLGAHQSLERREPAVLTVPLPRRWVALVLAGVLASSLVSSISYVRPWHDSQAMPQEQYVATVRAQSQETAPRLVDTAVPEVVLWSAAFPKNLASHVLAPLGRDLVYVDHGVDPRVLDAQGRIVPAMIDAGPRQALGPDECGYLLAPGERREIDLVTVIDFPFTMSLGVLSSARSSIEVTAGTVTREIDLPKGLGTAFQPTGGAFEAVEVENTGFADVCIGPISVGGLVPRSSS